MASTLMEALQHFDAAEANLSKLERLWDEIESLYPDGRSFGDYAVYEERCFAFDAVLEAIPKIDEWKPRITLYEAEQVAQMRFDASELGEAEEYIRVANELAVPGKQIRAYRFSFNRKRRELVRQALEEHVPLVDEGIRKVQAACDLSEPGATITGPEWVELKARLDELGVLLGSSAKRPPRWTDLRRHLSYGMVQDFNDILRSDWPPIKQALLKGLYEENDPVPVHVTDLGELVSTRPRGAVTTKLNWSILSDEEFERLLFVLISDEAGYENPEWLTKTNAADRGRDLSVTRVSQDGLAGTRRTRVIIQCKHWLAKSIALPDVASLVGQMELWPDVGDLVIATSGRFTTDAVDYIETFNRKAQALKIMPWPDSHLERLLNARPHLIAQFGLR